MILLFFLIFGLYACGDFSQANNQSTSEEAATQISTESEKQREDRKQNILSNHPIGIDGVDFMTCEVIAVNHEALTSKAACLMEPSFTAKAFFKDAYYELEHVLQRIDKAYFDADQNYFIEFTFPSDLESLLDQITIHARPLLNSKAKQTQAKLEKQENKKSSKKPKDKKNFSQGQNKVNKSDKNAKAKLKEKNKPQNS